LTNARLSSTVIKLTQYLIFQLILNITYFYFKI